MQKLWGKKIYVDGCSITAGGGFSKSKDDGSIYPNQISSQRNLYNNAESGSSNHKIFLRSSQSLVENFHDIYIVQWTALHRHWIHPAPNTGIYIGAPSDGFYEQRLTNFVTQYQLLNHDYTNILHLIVYIRILQDLAKSKNKQLIFINGLLPWTEDMLDHRLLLSKYHISLYESLDQLEQQKFYEQLKNNLELVDFSLWINPWNSIMSMQIDNAELDMHPGPNTHSIIVKMLEEKLHD